MSVHILIDSRWAGNTGIGNLYQEVMARMPPLVIPAFVESRMSLGHLCSPLMLARETARSKPDLFYSPSFMPPLYGKTPFVVTIHDLMHLFYYTPLHRIYYQQVIARLAKRAKQVITVSQFSKQQLMEHLGIPEEQITVIYNGVDDIFRTNQRTYPAGRPYFLYVGNQRKNKNIPAMLTAFSRARIPSDFLFLLTGKASPALRELIARLKITDRVRFLGFVNERDLPALYKGAHATLFVSLMEGFGLPLLESMASGTPVLTANTNALPEIAGKAAICADPRDTDAIAFGIETLISNDRIYQRCVQLGYERARLFSWDTTAEKTWKTILNP